MICPSVPGLVGAPDAVGVKISEPEIATLPDAATSRLCRVLPSMVPSPTINAPRVEIGLFDIPTTDWYQPNVSVRFPAACEYSPMVLEL